MNIRSKLPNKKQLHLVQARIDLELYKAVKKAKREDRVKWKELIEVLFKEYLRESGKKAS